MSDHNPVAAMAEEYAQKAVDQAREFHAQLDYSENSLQDLETILDRVAQTLPSAGSSSTDDLAEICKTWGSYLGEVVRRRFGGEWSIETYPGKQFATLTLTVQGSKMFPSIKVHRRLTQPDSEADNVWAFFQMVKQRLEAAPKVQ